MYTSIWIDSAGRIDVDVVSAVARVNTLRVLSIEVAHQALSTNNIAALNAQ